MFRFSRSYFILSLLLLLIEIFIGAKMHDAIIRPFGGDFLVVIWLYCLVRSFWQWPVLPTALLVLLLHFAAMHKEKMIFRMVLLVRAFCKTGRHYLPMKLPTDTRN